MEATARRKRLAVGAVVVVTLVFTYISSSALYNTKTTEREWARLDEKRRVVVECPDVGDKAVLICDCAEAEDSLEPVDVDLSSPDLHASSHSGVGSMLMPNPAGIFHLRAFPYRGPRKVHAGVTFVTAECGGDPHKRNVALTFGSVDGHRSAHADSDQARADPNNAASSTPTDPPSVVVLSMDSANNRLFDEYLPGLVDLLKARQVHPETVSDRWGNREASSAHDKSGTWQRTPEEVLRLTGVHAVEFADFWPIGPSTPPNLIGFMSGCALITNASLHKASLLFPLTPASARDRAMAADNAKAGVSETCNHTGNPADYASTGDGDRLYPFTRPEPVMCDCGAKMQCWAPDDGTTGRSRFDAADACAPGSNNEVFLWDILPRHGYATLYGEEICPHVHPWSPLVYVHGPDTRADYAEMREKHGQRSSDIPWKDLDWLAPSVFNDAPFPFLGFADHYIGEHMCTCALADTNGGYAWGDVCGTPFYHHTLGGLRRFWEVEKGPKFAFVDFQGAHTPWSSAKRVKEMDRPLQDIIAHFYDKDPNTVVILYSDHGRTHTEFKHHDATGADYIDVVLWVLGSEEALSKANLLNLARSARDIEHTAGFDLYATVLDLAGFGDHPALPPWAMSLIRDRWSGDDAPDKVERSCADAGIPMCLCNAETADACMDAYVKKAAKEPVDNDALNALFAAAGYNVG